MLVRMAWVGVPRFTVDVHNIVNNCCRRLGGWSGHDFGKFDKLKLKLACSVAFSLSITVYVQEMDEFLTCVNLKVQIGFVVVIALSC